MDTKTCKVCNETKPLDAFPARGRTCKACWVIWQRAFRRNKRIEYLAAHPPQPKPTEKACRICGIVKPLEEFNFARKQANQRTSYCRPCALERAYATRALRGRENEELFYRCRRMGTTAEWYRQKLAEQDGKCALCLQPEVHPVVRGGRTRNLAIDHDHGTVQVRGLLCFRCNTALHSLEKHGAAWAERAVTYLKKYERT